MSETVDTPVRRVAISGGGLAAWMTAAHLSHHLPETVAIMVVGSDETPDGDALYGQLLPPESYAFHLGIGLAEPELLLRTGTAFAFGGSVENWGTRGASWVQPFQLPLTNVGGVPLSTLVAQDAAASLQTYLVAAQAARAGRFAHPPEDAGNPLSRAEYGYLFDPVELTALYRAKATRVTHSAGRITDVDRKGDIVRAVTLDTGKTLTADLFIATEDRSLLTETLGGHTFHARLARVPTDGPELPLRRLVGQNWGWSSEVVTRNARLRLDVGHTLPGADSFPFQSGRNASPWRGNTLAIGRAACTIEPLTLAPVRLLLRDVARVADLFPVSTDMRVEAREYNVAARADQTHARLFHQAHFVGVEHPGDAYFATNAANPDPKLIRKIDQYAERAYLVGYDHEPFDALDWAVLHDGLRRKPRRSDALASRVDAATFDAFTQTTREGISTVVPKMPPHPLYMQKFLDYLKRKHNQAGRHVG